MHLVLSRGKHVLFNFSGFAQHALIGRLVHQSLVAAPRLISSVVARRVDLLYILGKSIAFRREPLVQLRLNGIVIDIRLHLVVDLTCCVLMYGVILHQLLLALTLSRLV